MNLFDISSYGWSDTLNIVVAHPTKTAEEFKLDVKEATKLIIEDYSKNEDVITVTTLLSLVADKLLSYFGYELPEFESNLNLIEEGIIGADFKETKKYLGKKIFEDIVKHNDNIRYLMYKDLEQK